MKMSLQNQTWTDFRRQGHVVKEELVEVALTKDIMETRLL